MGQNGSFIMVLRSSRKNLKGLKMNEKVREKHENIQEMQANFLKKLKFFPKKCTQIV